MVWTPYIAVQTATPETGPRSILEAKPHHEVRNQVGLSPLARKGVAIPKLDRCDLIARTQKRKLLVKRDTLTKAVKYVKEDDFANINCLIEKWKGIAQMASSYLLNDLKSKVNMMGGKTQWRKSCKQSTNTSGGQVERLESMKLFVESPGFDDLSKYEQTELQNCIEKLEDDCFRSSSDTPDTWDEFTMLDMYDTLKLDYDLIFDS